ncbi:hypothetical protein CMV_018489 [Castanea mollissima]|uniref:FBD domain-containing protein n=1 Tax=Castanea mollissima TaxID=60419 RepID=A0A8J4QUZ4_9ROSI|nr:hypothetical protein CMV_018489 [Castanea mollissima]
MERMDVSSSVCNTKNQKFSKERDVGEGENRIDNLADAIVQHILSFFPTKDAAKTSILSNRWKYLWLSVPVLDFHDGAYHFTDAEEPPHKRKLFMDFVERVLLLREPSTITNFSLACNVLSDSSRITTWISAAVKHKVQILTLIRIVFPDDHSAQKLFKVCSILEELYLIFCSWENVKAVCISSPKIQKLYIQEKDTSYCTDTDDEDGENNSVDQNNDSDNESDNIDDQNSPVYLNDDIDDVHSSDEQSDDADDQCDSDGCQFAVFGTSLKYFSYMGDFVHDCHIQDSSSIVEAHLQAYNGDRKIGYRALKLLRGLSNAKSLKLDDNAVESLADADELLDHLPMFYNLTHIHIDWVVLIYKQQREALLTILRKSPCLSSLKFEGLSFKFCYSGTYDWTLDPVPGCFLTHLKTIEISMFNGSEIELLAVKILLKSATVLEKMVISFNPWEFEDTDGLKKQQEVQEQILSFPRGSSSCLIAISCPPKKNKTIEFC